MASPTIKVVLQVYFLGQTSSRMVLSRGRDTGGHQSATPHSSSSTALRTDPIFVLTQTSGDMATRGHVTVGMKLTDGDVATRRRVYHRKGARFGNGAGAGLWSLSTF